MEDFKEVLTFEVEITRYEAVRGKNGEAAMVFSAVKQIVKIFMAKSFPAE